MNSEQHCTHYLLFVIRSDKNCFGARQRRIFSFNFVKNPPHQRNSDETLAMKNRFAETTNNSLHTFVFRLLFVVSLVFRRYSWMVFSGFKMLSETSYIQFWQRIYTCARCALRSLKSFFLHRKYCDACSVAKTGLQPIIFFIGSLQGTNFGSVNIIWKPRNNVGSGMKLRSCK